MSRTRLAMLVSLLAVLQACAGRQIVPDEQTFATADGEPDTAAAEEPATEAALDSEDVSAQEAETAEETGSTDADEESGAEAQARAEREARAEELKQGLESSFSVVKSAVERGQLDEAVVTLEKAVQAQPDAWAAYYNLALLSERQGKRERAVEFYQQALKLNPEYEAASANLTRLYIRTNQLRQAEGELRKRITAFPRNTAFRNQLARVLIEQGGERVKLAEAESKRVLKFDERNVDAMVNLGTIWFREGKFELAKQVLDNAREIDETNPAVWNLIAFTQLRLDMKPLALDSFRKAAALRDDFPEAHNNLGAMLNEVNDCDGAIRELETAVAYAPDWAEARLNLGNAYRCARQYEKAKAEYESALSLERRDASGAEKSDPYFNLAILYLDGDMPGVAKLERLKQSVAYFDKYESMGGDDPRTARYMDEARKNIDKEAKRLERVFEQERRAEKRRLEEEAARLAEEERQRAELAARHARIEKMKVAGKSDIVVEEPKVIAPEPIRERPRMKKVPKADLPAGEGMM